MTGPLSVFLYTGTNTWFKTIDSGLAPGLTETGTPCSMAEVSVALPDIPEGRAAGAGTAAGAADTATGSTNMEVEGAGVIVFCISPVGTGGMTGSGVCVGGMPRRL